MTKCYQTEWTFPACKSRKIQVDFKGGTVSSDGGILLLRQVDRELQLTRRAALRLPERRRRRSCEHSQMELVRQRVFGLAQGYEDLNDHHRLRHDPLLQTATDRDEELGSPSTLCRWENRMDRQAAWALHELLVEIFIESFAQPPEELILDIDATDTPIHGRQEGRFFHGYYDHYCFLPLQVFCGHQLLVNYLRPSNIDGARHAWAVLKLLCGRLREAWPKVRLIVRADSGFCRWRMLRWMERNRIDYLIGLARNDRVNAAAESLHERAAWAHEMSGQKETRFGWIDYGAHTWDRERRVIAKAEHSDRGANPRYVVTSLRGSARKRYELYCARGDAENRVKEVQLDMFSDRTSCHAWWANQFRLLLSSLAYVLLERMRALGLQGTELARAQVSTLRLKLLKIGAVVVRNTRRVRVHLSSAFPYQELFILLAQRLAPG